MAIDDYLEDPEKYQANLPFYRTEIAKCTYREYTTGFFFGKPDETTQIYDESTYIKEWIYLGTIGEEKKETDGRTYYRLEQKNKFSVGDEVEIMQPDGNNLNVQVQDMMDEEGNKITSCPHAKQIFYADFGVSLKPYYIIRFRPQD